MRLDHEVLELLRHDPELLAIADAIVATQLPDGEGPAEPELRQWAGRAHRGRAARAARPGRLSE